jgi:hypothetical protein
MDVATWPPLTIEAEEKLTTSARALDNPVLLAGQTQIGPFAVVNEMVSHVLADHQVFPSVVGLVLVAVMDPLTWEEEPAQVGFGHQTVLIDVPVPLGSRMIGPMNRHVALAVDGQPSFPMVTVLARLAGHQ